MNEFLIYGIGAVFFCFTAATFLLSRMQTDIFPEEYQFSLDPFWYIAGVMFVGSSAVYFLFPPVADAVKTYSYLDFGLPFGLAVLIYFSYLFNIPLVTNIFTLAAAGFISWLQPDEFRLFPEQLTLWQDRLAVAAILFFFSKGMGVLNGLGGIASMQFNAVMISAFILVYFGALPQLLGVIALAYLGAMLAFTFFSWPPEKILMSNGAFCSFGFIMGCFMLNAANEYAESAMCIATAFLITETGIALYNRYVNWNITDDLFMNTSYYRISHDGLYETGVAQGVLKIIVINIVLSMVQLAANERLAIPVFAVAVDVWLLSILSGDTKPEEMFSIAKWGKKTVSTVFSRKKEKNSKK